MGHQLEIMELIVQLNRERGLTIVLVLHDLNQAARYADRMLAMKGGRIVADGPPREIFAPALLREVFGVLVNVVTDPASGAPVCIPYAAATDELLPAGT